MEKEEIFNELNKDYFSKGTLYRRAAETYRSEMDTPNRLIELLEIEKPMFQVKSGIKEFPSSERFFVEGAKHTTGFARACHVVSKEVLRYLASIMKPNNITLETGGGYSTAVFAVCSLKHICVNPDITANELIKCFLQKHGYAYEHLEFLEDSSDKGLSKLKLEEKVDVALIDGNHSFPFPIIDWHYIDGFLRRGSKILIYDIHINSVKIVSDFLLSEPSYEYITTIGTCAAFEKINDTRVIGWASQGINIKSMEGHSVPPRLRPRHRGFFHWVPPKRLLELLSRRQSTGSGRTGT